MAEAAEETTYDAAPAAPPPSWNILVAGLAAPEGFDLAPLVAEVGGGSRARISAVDAEALAKAAEDAKDSALGAEIKAWRAENAGQPLAGEFLVKALQGKFDADREAGVEKKAAPPPEAGEEAAAAPAAAPAEGEEGATPFVDEPPDVDKSADVYYVVQNFPRNVADVAAAAAAGVPVDALLTLKLTTADLAASGATEAAAAAVAAEKAKRAPPPGEGEEAAAAAEGEGEGEEEAFELPPPALTTALAAAAEGGEAGLGSTVLVDVDGLAPADFASAPALFARASSLLYAIAQKRRMYDAWRAPLKALEVPVGPPPVDTAHYERLLDAAPPYALGVPYILHCLCEQVCAAALTLPFRPLFRPLTPLSPLAGGAFRDAARGSGGPRGREGPRRRRRFPRHRRHRRAAAQIGGGRRGGGGGGGVDRGGDAAFP